MTLLVEFGKMELKILSCQANIHFHKLKGMQNISNSRNSQHDNKTGNGKAEYSLLVLKNFSLNL